MKESWVIREIILSMQKKEISIDFKIGIHSRPAALLVKKIREYGDHKIYLANNGKKAQGNSLIGLLSLGIGEGAVVEISVEGPREREVLDEVIDFFHNKVAVEG